MDERIQAVLCFLVRDQRVVLAKKKKKVGVGRWNGYGGKIEPGQTREQAVVDEVREECGVYVEVDGLRSSGTIKFDNTDENGNVAWFIVHVYLALGWSGEPKESDEMGPPAWFDCHRLPFDEMMPADRFWLPLVLDGQVVTADVMYGPRQESLIGPIEVSVR